MAAVRARLRAGANAHMMVEAVTSYSTASEVMNAYIRELSGVRATRRPSNPQTVNRTDETKRLGGKSELTEDEKREVEKLKQRDREVRNHESAHKASAGQYAKGSPKFEFTRGPDGRQYASGGEVQIDTSEIPDDPQATIRKMQQVRRAATAPASPSSQDRQVAAQAAQAEAQARIESSQASQESAGANATAARKAYSPLQAEAVGQTNSARSSLPTGSFIDIRA